MLEKYLSKFLVSRFGRYVKGLDQDNLRIAAWQGEIKLENMELRTDVLDELELPVDVKWGHLGLLHLTVPWGSLGTNPIRVVLEDIFLVVTPLQPWEMSQSELAQRSRAAKKKKVESLQLKMELIKQQKAAASQDEDQDADSKAQNSSYFQKLFARAIANLQVTIKNVHIRYEDNISSNDNPLAAGIVMEGLNIQSMEADFSKESEQEVSITGNVHKQLSVSNLGVYVDILTGQPARSSVHYFLDNPPELKTFLRRGVHGQHNFIVQQLSPLVRLIMTPMKCEVKTVFEEIKVALEKRQVELVSRVMNTLSSIDVLTEVYRLRPRMAVMEDKRAWWRYAINAVIYRAGKRKKLTWNRYFNLTRQRKLYVSLWKRVTAANSLQVLNGEELEKLDALDDTLTIDELVTFRMLAKDMVDLETQKQKEEKASRSRVQAVYNWWHGAAKTMEDDDLSAEAATKELFSALQIEDFEDGGQATIAPDEVLWEVNACLTGGTVTLVHKQRPLLSLNFDCVYGLQIKKNSWDLNLDLGALTVFDCQAHGKFATILSRKRNHEGDQLVVGDTQVMQSASCTVQYNPLMVDKGKDLSIAAKIHPFEVLFTKECFERTVSFFSGAVLQDLKNEAVRKFDQWQAQKQVEVYQALASQRKIEIDLQIAAPLVVIPDAPQETEHTAVLLIDLGNFSLHNHESKVELSSKASSTLNCQGWKVEMLNVQTLMCTNSTLFFDTEDQASFPRIVEPFDVVLDITSCLTEEASRVWVDACLPRLSFHFSKLAYHLLLRLKDRFRASKGPKREGSLQKSDLELSKTQIEALGVWQSSQSNGAQDMQQEIASIVLPDEQSDPDTSWSFMVEVDFTAPKILFDLSDEATLLETSISGIGGNLIQKAEEHQFSVWVTEVNVVDHVQQAGMEFQNLVRSHGGDIGALENSEDIQGLARVDFAQKDGVSDISLMFGTLELEWNPETLVTVQQFFHYGEHEEAILNEEPQDGEKTQANDDAPNQIVPESTNAPGIVACKVYLQALVISLNKEKQKVKVANVAMKNTSISYTSKDNRQVIEGQIGNLQLSDTGTAGTFYEELMGLHTEGDSLLEFSYSNYDYSAEGKKLHLTFSPMRFVYINQIWLEIIDYFFEGVLGDALWSTPKSNSVASQEQGQKQSEPFYMEIDLSSPLLLLPVDAFAREYIQVDLGKIHVANEFKNSDQIFNLDFKEIDLSNHTGQTLLDKTLPMQIVVIKAMGTEPVDRAHKMLVDGLLAGVRLRVCQKDYALLNHIIELNLGGEPYSLPSQHPPMVGEALQGTSLREVGFIRYQYGTSGDVLTYHVSFTIEDLGVDLIPGKSDGGQRIGALDCSKLKWQMAKNQDESSWMDVCLDDISLEENHSGSPFQKLLGPIDANDFSTTNDENPTQLRYRSQQNSQGDREKELSISKACIYTVQQGIQNLRDFINFEEHPRSNEVKLRKQTSFKDDAVVQGSAEKSKFSVHLVEPKIFLIQNPHDPKSRMIVFGCDIQYEVDTNPDGSSTSTASFMNAEVYSTSFQFTHKAFLNPFSCKICSESGNGSSSLDVEIDALAFHTSYSGLQLVLDIFDQWTEIMKDPKSNHPSSSVTEESLSLESKNEMDSGSMESKEEKNGGLETKSTSRIKVSCNGVTLKLTDDSHNHFTNKQDLLNIHVGGFILEQTGMFDDRHSTQCLVCRVDAFEVVDLLQPCEAFREMINFDTAPDEVFILKSECNKDTSTNAEHSEISLDFKGIILRWNPRTLVALQQFTKGLLSPRSTGDRANMTSDDGVDVLTEGKWDKSCRICIASVQMHLNKELEERTLAIINLEKINIAYTRSKNEISLLGDIFQCKAIDACSSTSIYKEVIGQEDQTVPTLDFSYDSKDDKTTIALAFNGGVHIIYIQQFWMELIDYFLEGILGEAVWGTVAQATSFMQKQLRGGADFKIKLVKPTLILPVRDNSSDCLKGILGHVDIHSTVKIEPTDFAQTQHAGSEDWQPENMGLDQSIVINHTNEDSEDHSIIAIRDSSINIKEVEFACESRTACKKLLRDKVQIDVKISQAMDGNYARFLEQKYDIELPIKIDCELSALNVLLTQPSWHVLYGVVNRNLLAVNVHGDESLRVSRGVDLPSEINVQDHQLNKKSHCCACAAEFNKIVRRHICRKCLQQVCRNCLKTKVFDLTTRLRAFICRPCSRRNFKELETEFEQTVNFNFGNDMLATAFKLHFHTPVLSLCLFNGEQSLDGNNALVLFSLDGLNLDFDRKADRSGLLDFSVARLSVKDLRSNAAFQDLICAEGCNDTQAVNQECPQFVISYHMSDNPVLGISLNSLQVYTVTSAFMRIKSFLNIPTELQAGVVNGQTDSALVDLQLLTDGQSPKNQKIKVAVHYPKVLLLENERSSTSRAIIMQGLFNFQYISHQDGERDNLKDVATSTLQVDSLEIYIVENVSQQSDRTSLLEPVTSNITFESTYQTLYAPVHELTLIIDGIETQTSHGDILLISNILERWSRSNESITGLEPESAELQTEEREETSQKYVTFDFLFERKSLGMRLAPASEGDHVVVEEDLEERHGGPKRGDILFAINGSPICSTLSFDDVVQILRNESRPILLSFQRPMLDVAEGFLIDNLKDLDYSVKFGAPELGLSIGSSKYGNKTIVMKRAVAYDRVILPGTVIVGINDINVEKVSFDQIKKYLKEFPRPVEVHFREVRKWDPIYIFSGAIPNGLKALVINDFKGKDQPLLQIEVSNCAFRGVKSVFLERMQKVNSNISDNKDILQMQLTMDLLIDSFNNYCGLWEPLLEPIQADLDLESSEEGMATRLQLKNEVNLTVTEAALELFLNTANEWQQDTEDAVRSQPTEKFHPFVFVNQTGFPVSFTVFNRSEQPPLEIRVDELGAGEAYPFSLQDGFKRCPVTNTAHGQRREYNLQPAVNIRLAGSYGLLRDMELLKPGVYPQFVTGVPPSEGGSAEELAEVNWEVQLQSGRRRLILRSAIQVFNETPVDLEIFAASTMNTKLSLGAVASGESLPVPLCGMLHQGSLSLKPIIPGKEFVQSNQFIDLSCLNRVKHFIQTPLTNASSKEALNFNIHLKEELDSHNIYIYPPLTIQNFLPTRLDIEVQIQLERRQTKIHTLNAGDSKSLQEVNYFAFNDEQIAFKIPGYETNNGISFTGLRNIVPSSKSVKLSCRNAYGSFYFNVACSTSEDRPNAFAISVYCDFWISNQSGLPLVYGERQFNQEKRAIGFNVAPEQSDIVVEEVFEIQKKKRGKWEPRGWVGENPSFLVCYSRDEIVLPNENWEWLGDWDLDLSGHVHQQDGWESCGQGGRFKRQFNDKDIIRRRRWFRARHRIQSTTEETNYNSVKALMYQPDKKHQELCVKVGDSSWSEAIEIGVQGAEGCVEINDSRWPSVTNQCPVHSLAYCVSSLPSPWEQTQLVTFLPRFILVNVGSRVILACQAQSQTIIPIPPKSRVPFHWSNGKLPRYILLKFEDCGQHWSGPIDIESIGTCVASIRGGAQDVDEVDGQQRISERDGVVKVQVMIGKGYKGSKGGSNEVVLQEEDNIVHSFRIQNDTSHEIFYSQVGFKGTRLGPLDSRIFGWDDPRQNQPEDNLKMLISPYPLDSNDGQRYSGTIDPMAIGKKMKLSISPTTRQSGSKIEITIRPDGPTKVIHVTDASNVRRKKKVNLNKAIAGSRQRKRNRKNVKTLHVDDKGSQKEKVDVRFKAQVVNISFVQQKYGEVFLGWIDQIQFGYKKQGGHFEAEVQVKDFQIDNHHPYCTYPVLLQPSSAKQVTNSPMSSRAHSLLETQPFLLLNIVGVSTPHPHTYYYRTVSCGTKKMNVNVDESLLEVLQSFWKVSTDAESKLKQTKVLGKNTWPLPEEVLGSNNSSLTEEMIQAQYETMTTFYFELLRIKKLEFNLTFDRPRVTRENVYIGIRPLKMLKDILARVDEAPFHFEPLILRHDTYSRDQLQSIIQKFYMGQLKKHIFSLLGSLKAFGNPIGLIRNIGKGAEDFIVEPLAGLAEGFEELRPDKFVTGVARGTFSLIHHTVGGAAKSAALITSTLSHNLSNLALDKNYKVRRDEEHRERPTDLLEGLGSGGMRILKGVGSGVAGVWKKPIQGAKRKGVEGFAGGLLRGAAGLVVKPVVAISDAATDVLHGLKGTTETTFEAKQRGLVRPKRACYGKEKAIRPYNLEDAQAVLLLSQHKTFTNDDYVAHIDTGTSVVILTLQHVLDISEDGTVHQFTSIRAISGCDIQNDGIVIFSSENNIQISCSSKEQCIKIYHQIENLRSAKI